MRHVALIVPGDPETRTGGYIYDKRIVQGLRVLGWHVDVCGPSLATLSDGCIALVDGLALLTCGNLEPHAERLAIVLLVHLPLALEVGLDPAEAARRHEIEQRALTTARLVIATGRATADSLAERGVAHERIALIEPGTDRAPIARGSRRASVSLLCVAAMTPGKGHERLLRALSTVPSRDWTLTCVGSIDRDPAAFARVSAVAQQLQLSDRVTFAGELDEAQLADQYDRSDAFVLATIRETYGMVVAEAIARGLPVVSTSVGAVPEIVGAGGILVGLDDAGGLETALTRVIEDPAARQQLAAGARAARERLHTWDEASRSMATALTRMEKDDRLAR